MNRIVICFFRNPFFNGRLHCKEIVKRWSTCSFFKTCHLSGADRHSRSRSLVSGAERDRCDTEDGVHHKHRPHTGACEIRTKFEPTQIPGRMSHHDEIGFDYKKRVC